MRACLMQAAYHGYPAGNDDRNRNASRTDAGNDKTCVNNATITAADTDVFSRIIAGVR